MRIGTNRKPRWKRGDGVPNLWSSLYRGCCLCRRRRCCCWAFCFTGGQQVDGYNREHNSQQFALRHGFLEHCEAKERRHYYVQRCGWTQRANTDTHLCKLLVCVCVCVCEQRERERGVYEREQKCLKRAVNLVVANVSHGIAHSTGQTPNVNLRPWFKLGASCDEHCTTKHAPIMCGPFWQHKHYTKVRFGGGGERVKRSNCNWRGLLQYIPQKGHSVIQFVAHKSHQKGIQAQSQQADSHPENYGCLFGCLRSASPFIKQSKESHYRAFSVSCSVALKKMGRLTTTSQALCFQLLGAKRRNNNINFRKHVQLNSNVESPQTNKNQNFRSCWAESIRSQLHKWI